MQHASIKMCLGSTGGEKDVGRRRAEEEVDASLAAFVDSHPPPYTTVEIPLRIAVSRCIDRDEHSKVKIDDRWQDSN